MLTIIDQSHGVGGPQFGATRRQRLGSAHVRIRARMPALGPRRRPPGPARPSVFYSVVVPVARASAGVGVGTGVGPGARRSPRRGPSPVAEPAPGPRLSTEVMI